jgi:general L-amino acid transport system permease protein
MPEAEASAKQSYPPKTTPSAWMRRNLCSTWYNGLLTLICLALLIWGITTIVSWLRSAQWAVVTANLRLFFVGRYPPSQVWRVWVVAAIWGMIAAAWLWRQFSGKSVSDRSTRSHLLPHLVLLSLPIALALSLWLLGGGLGLTQIGTDLWGGLLLTLLVSSVSIALAFPIGVLLALGRQSPLPAVRWLSTGYIELVRGLPLIGILFMAQVMLPLVLPLGVRPDRLLRAIAGLVLFNAAYLAENVRGGLQSIPRGQVEAAHALGLNSVLTLLLIVLPQALRTVIPPIVGQFISLLKDTSLLSLFALLELTGIGRSVLAQPQFLGRHAEVYLFVGLIYWLFCYGMSQISRRLERGRS